MAFTKTYDLSLTTSATFAVRNAAKEVDYSPRLDSSAIVAVARLVSQYGPILSVAEGYNRNYTILTSHHEHDVVYNGGGFFFKTTLIFTTTELAWKKSRLRVAVAKDDQAAIAAIADWAHRGIHAPVGMCDSGVDFYSLWHDAKAAQR